MCFCIYFRNILILKKTGQDFFFRQPPSIEWKAKNLALGKISFCSQMGGVHTFRNLLISLYMELCLITSGRSELNI